MVVYREEVKGESVVWDSRFLHFVRLGAVLVARAFENWFNVR